MINTANPGIKGSQVPTNSGQNNGTLTLAAPTSPNFTVDSFPQVFVGFLSDPSDYIKIQVGDGKGNWSDWYVQSSAQRLTTVNNIIPVKIPGLYRLVYSGSTQALYRAFPANGLQSFDYPLTGSGGGGGGSQTLSVVAPTSLQISGGNTVDLSTIVIAGQTNLTANDSATIDFTTSGVAQHTLTGSVKVSANVGNALSAVADGLFVSSGVVSNATDSVTGVVRIATATQAKTGTAHYAAVANATGEIGVLTTPAPTLTPFDLKTQPAMISSATTAISTLTNSDIRVIINSVTPTIDISTQRGTAISCDNTANVGGNYSVQLGSGGTLAGYTNFMSGDYALMAASGEASLTGYYSTCIASNGAVGSAVTVSGNTSAAIAVGGPATVSGTHAVILGGGNSIASGDISGVYSSDVCTATATRCVVIGSVSSNATTNTSAGVYSSETCTASGQDSAVIAGSTNTASGSRSFIAGSLSSTSAAIDGVIVGTTSGSILNTAAEAFIAASNLGTVSGTRSAILTSNNVVIQAGATDCTSISSESIAAIGGTGNLLGASNTAALGGTNCTILATNPNGSTGATISAGTGNAIIASRVSTISGSNFNFVAASGTAGAAVTVQNTSGGNNTVLSSNTATVNSFFSTQASAFTVTDNGTANFTGAVVTASYTSTATTCAGVASTSLTFGTSNTNNIALGSNGVTFNASATRGSALSAASVTDVQTTTISGSTCSIVGSEDSRVSDTCSVVIGSHGSTVNNGFQVMLASNRTLAGATNYRVVGGYNAAGAPATSNRKWEIDSVTGDVRISGTLTSSYVFPDYAELFPNAHTDEIAVGTPVTWDRSKKGVRPALQNERIRGIVSATSTVVGGDTELQAKAYWKYDEFGRREKQIDVNGIESYVVNPAFNPSLTNIPRSQRPKEWTQVGLLGQVFTRIDASVTENTEFLKASNGICCHSDEPTNLEVQEITSLFDTTKGYGVAYVFIR